MVLFVTHIYSASKQGVIVSVLKSLVFSILNVFSVSCICYHHKDVSFGMLRRKIGCNSSLETWTGVTQSGEPPLEKVSYARLGCVIITSADNTLEP